MPSCTSATCCPCPTASTWAEAGGFPEAFTTAHDALFTQCGLAMGERVCVHGAAGGVGVAGVQLAVAAGCTVVATVRNAVLRDAVAAFGADAPSTPTASATTGRSTSCSSSSARPNLADDLRSLATGGRIAVIGVGGGAEAELNLLDADAASGAASTARRCGPAASRTRPPRPGPSSATCSRCSPPARVRVPVEATFPMAEAAAAYERFAAGGKLGKIVLVNDA